MARRPSKDLVNEALGAEGDAADEALASDRIERTGKIVIVSRTAGFRRAGIVHPLRKEYPLNAFSEEQLDAFDAEPELDVLIVGNPDTEDTAETANAGNGLPFIGDTEI